MTAAKGSSMNRFTTGVESRVLQGWPDYAALCPQTVRATLAQSTWRWCSRRPKTKLSTCVSGYEKFAAPLMHVAIFVRSDGLAMLINSLSVWRSQCPARLLALVKLNIVRQSDFGRSCTMLLPCLSAACPGQMRDRLRRRVTIRRHAGGAHPVFRTRAVAVQPQPSQSKQ